MTKELNNKYMTAFKKPRNNFCVKKNIKSKLVLGKKQKVPIYISIVVPTFLRVETLKYTLRSILNQKLKEDIEVIIVDNSGDLTSSNPTYLYLKELNDNRILYYQNIENIGVAGNWNRCIELSRGKYISMIHDDDMIADGYLARIEKYLRDLDEKKMNVGVIKSSFIINYNYEHPYKIKYSDCGLLKVSYEQCLLAGRTPTGTPTCGMIFNKNAIISVGGFDERLHPVSDQVIGYFILKNGYNIYCTKEKLGYYCIGVNDSLQKEVVLECFKHDYYFRKFLYHDSLASYIFGLLFEKIQYNESITGFYETIRNRKLNITKKELDFLRKGNQHHPFLKFLFNTYSKIQMKRRGYDIPF